MVHTPPFDHSHAHVGIDDWQRYVRQDERFIRPAEVDVLVGDPTKAREVLGWKPTIDFRTLVAMMVDADLIEQERLITS